VDLDPGFLSGLKKKLASRRDFLAGSGKFREYSDLIVAGVTGLHQSLSVFEVLLLATLQGILEAKTR